MSTIPDIIHNLGVVREALEHEGLAVHVKLIDEAIEDLSVGWRSTPQPEDDEKSAEELLTPRPIAEWHEDMGPMLWWRWTWFDGSKRWDWANEEPYVGSPLDLGFTVEAHTTTRLITQSNQEHDPDPIIHRINAAGWPGYHTHFTPIPFPQSPDGSETP